MAPERPAAGGLPRWVDLLLAACGLVVTAPLLAACAAAVAATSRGPILYRQERIGRDGRSFTFLKLRTMARGAGGPGVTLGSDPRVTTVGRFLRRSKLDELPSLWNVVRGELALVGPRPEVPRFVDLGHPEWHEVLRVRPGLTDPVTLSLRNEEQLIAASRLGPEPFYRRHLLPYKLAGYRRYLATRSWRSDLAVLLHSVLAVARPASSEPPTLYQIARGEGASWPPAPGAGGGRFSLLRQLQLVVDVSVLVAAFVLAYLLRFDFTIPRESFFPMLFQLPWVVLLQASLIFLTGIHAFFWRYVGLREVASFARAASASALVLLAFRLGLPVAYQAFRAPLSVIVLDTVLAFGGLLGVRVLRRLVYERLEREGRARGTAGERRKPVLLVGAGRAGVLAVREIQGRGDMDIEPVGFVDDDPLKQGTLIHGIRVLGTIDDVPNLVRRIEVDHVILTIAEPDPNRLRRILEICERERLKVRTIPGFFELLQGKVSGGRFRDVEVEEHLGREPVRLGTAEAERSLLGKRVMVTGAGGSIGSELARQIARFSPARLVLFDRAEFALSEIDRELRELWPDLDLVAVVGDVCDEGRVRRALAEHRPDVVFHAASHNQVSLMEANAAEAVRSNVLGSFHLGRLAAEAGVEAVVLISTAKAVRPASIMGASKRLSEMVIQHLGARSPGTRMLAVRCGNVMGSAGSVLEIFHRQLAAGGPLTLTHPAMTRYFMTTTEAVQLVLQAAAMGESGEVFVLDMGEPVKILELARRMIASSGFDPDREIGIVFTGLRPGEKLADELELAGEQIAKTRHPKIYIGRLNPYPATAVDAALARLAALIEGGDEGGIRELLSALIPDAELGRRQEVVLAAGE